MKRDISIYLTDILELKDVITKMKEKYGKS